MLKIFTNIYMVVLIVLIVIVLFFLLRSFIINMEKKRLEVLEFRQERRNKLNNYCLEKIEELETRIKILENDNKL